MRHVPRSERFWWHVTPGDPDECWLWTGSLNGPGGYGQLAEREFGSHGRQIKHYAHRVSYELHHGPIPEGARILHTCDTPPCVNPRHLYAGSLSDNSRDMVVRGRSTRKLTSAQVAEIRAKSAGGASTRTLAAIYGLSFQGIARIVSGKTYKL